MDVLIWNIDMFIIAVINYVESVFQGILKKHTNLERITFKV